MTTREWWKKYYRALRVCRREAMKATQDMMLYGTGVVKVSADGEAERIHPKDVNLIFSGNELIKAAWKTQP